MTPDTWRVSRDVSLPEESVKTFHVCFQASEILRKLCMQNMVWSYCKKISPEWKLQVSSVSLQWVSCVLCLSFSSLSAHLVEQMEQKMTASDIFKDKKDNYPQSVPKLFVSTRLSKKDFPPPLLRQIIVIPVQVSPFTLRDLSSISPLGQMVKTLTPRCCRLWATRRWRLVEIRYTNQSRKGFL